MVLDVRKIHFVLTHCDFKVEEFNMLESMRPKAENLIKKLVEPTKQMIDPNRIILLGQYDDKT